MQYRKGELIMDGWMMPWCSRYSGNPKYIGGAVAFSKEDFKRINGFPNNFWGWGGEDDEMRHRINEVRRFIVDHELNECPFVAKC